MMRFRPLLLIAVVLSVGLGGALYRAARSSSEPAASHGPIGAPRPEVGPESSELAELREEVFALRHLVRSHERRLVGADATAAPSQAEPPEPEDRAEQLRRYHEYIAGVEVAFRKEPRDPRWSADTSAVIQAVLAANQELRPLAGSVECRSQTCRVEVTDDGSGGLRKQMPMLAQLVGQVLPSMTSDRVEDGSGHATMVLYFSRTVETASMP